MTLRARAPEPEVDLREKQEEGIISVEGNEKVQAAYRQVGFNNIFARGDENVFALTTLQTYHSYKAKNRIESRTK